MAQKTNFNAGTVPTVRQVSKGVAPWEPGVHRELPYGAHSLYLVIYPSGRRAFAFRYRNSTGASRKITLGSIETITLKDAIAKAKQYAGRVTSGEDPAAPSVPSDNASGITVRAAVARFIDDYCIGTNAAKVRAGEKGHAPKNRSWRETERQFTAYVLPTLGDRALADVTGDELRKLVRDLDKQTMANRLHATLSKWTTWCADREHKLIPANPYSGFKKPHGETSRDRVLSDEELASLWRGVTRAGGHFGSIVRLLILTGQRREEVTGLVRSELDYKRAEWTIPAERAKNSNRTIVPLSSAAIAEVLRFEKFNRDALLFSTNGKTPFSGHQKRKDRLDETLQFVEPWRLHDIRRTLATGLARLHVPQEVTEAILNHTSGKVSGIAGVYNRHDYADEKREALMLWSRHVAWIALPVRTDDDSQWSAQAAFNHVARTSKKRTVKQLNEQHDTALRGPEGAWSQHLKKWQRVARLIEAKS